MTDERIDAWDYLLEGDLDLSTMTVEPSIEGVEMVRAGAPAWILEAMAKKMGRPLVWMYGTLEIPRSSGGRKRRHGRRLSPRQSERILGLLRVVAKVERMVGESGDPTGFDPWEWVATWIDSPIRALGARKPAGLMDTADGRLLVMNFLGQMESGVYA